MSSLFWNRAPRPPPCMILLLMLPVVSKAKNGTCRNYTARLDLSTRCPVLQARRISQIVAVPIFSRAEHKMQRGEKILTFGPAIQRNPDKEKGVVTRIRRQHWWSNLGCSGQGWPCTWVWIGTMFLTWNIIIYSNISKGIQIIKLPQKLGPGFIGVITFHYIK